MLRFLILVGYLELSMYLKLSGKLDQYINTHYSYLAYISMALAFILAMVQLVIWMKQIKVHSHLHGTLAKLSSIVLMTFPIFVGLCVPTVTLDSTTVSAKGYHFPLAEGSSSSGQSSDGTSVQYLKPDTSLYFTKSAYESEMKKAEKAYLGTDKLVITTQNYMEVMEIIYKYPNDFIGREIEYVGFVYNDPEDSDSQFLFRFGIIHCIADSGVYGLLTTDASEHYENNTWVKATGTIRLEYNQNLKQTLPVLHITKSQKTQEPQNPYVYRTF
ncbi:TIGR03943 family putative permease subunit [Streptococcus porcorum]|uniref:Membrane protein n=1 Tax=Streptococcus porcorum TaxID=701526 RepID=A0ABV2JHM6_9STRE|nr:TIGR03943 family protein [Streptococcus sp.]